MSNGSGFQLIADSGSTKTDWVALDPQGRPFQFRSEGLNPLFLTAPQITDRARTALRELNEPVSAIYFYGASCSSQPRCARVKEGLSAIFPTARIVVQDDLVGAARGLLNTTPGLIGILGTGSNAGLYDGKNIDERLGGLGYVLGDEGSGQDIGKRFITKLMNREIPAELDEKFRERYELTDNDISNRVYSEPLPNRFLAGFSKFVKDHIEYPECREVAHESISIYLRRYVVRLMGMKNLPFAVIGSVGVAFRDILEEICHFEGIELFETAVSPIQGLIEYYKAHD